MNSWLSNDAMLLGVGIVLVVVGVCDQIFQYWESKK